MTSDADVSGQVIQRRESNNNYSQGDPSAMWYRFAGRQIGMVTNNGGWEGSYAASVVQRQTAPATAAPCVFANGATALVIHTPMTLIRGHVRLSLAAYRLCQPQTRPTAIGHLWPLRDGRAFNLIAIGGAVFRFGQLLPQAMPRQWLRASLGAQDGVSKQSLLGFKASTAWLEACYSKQTTHNAVIPDGEADPGPPSASA